MQRTMSRVSTSSPDLVGPAYCCCGTAEGDGTDDDSHLTWQAAAAPPENNGEERNLSYFLPFKSLINVYPLFVKF